MRGHRAHLAMAATARHAEQPGTSEPLSHADFENSLQRRVKARIADVASPTNTCPRCGAPAGRFRVAREGYDELREARAVRRDGPAWNVAAAVVGVLCATRNPIATGTARRFILWSTL